MNRQKIERQELNGKCSFCGRTFSKAMMTNHLKSCEQRKKTPMEPSYGGKSKLGNKRVFHIIVEGSYQPEYWMHLDVPADVKLEELDDFLREIWFECCGHLSAFTIGNIRYERETGGVNAKWTMIFGRRMPTKSMKIRTRTVLRSGLKFHYEYDFGTPTHSDARRINHWQKHSLATLMFLGTLVTKPSFAFMYALTAHFCSRFPADLTNYWRRFIPGQNLN